MGLFGKESGSLRQRDSRCCSAALRSCGRGATGLRAAGSMTNRFLSFAQPHSAAVQGERLLTVLTPKHKRRIARRASLLPAPSCRFRVGLATTLLRGRRRHAVAVVLDLRGVGLSPFSITFVRQALLGARAWRRSPLGHYDAPSSVDLLWERTSSTTSRNRLQGLRPNSSRNFSFAAWRVRFRSVGRFRPARFM